MYKRGRGTGVEGEGGWGGGVLLREQSAAADSPSMAAGWGGATSGCLCSPLGRSACTNKPTPGLWSNGNQTCPRTKSPSCSLPPLLLPPTHTHTQTHTPAEGRSSIISNRPENIPRSSRWFFPTQLRLVTSRRRR